MQLVEKLPAMWEIGFDPWVGKIPWRRERLPPQVFWPGEFHGLYSPWGRKELDTTEQLSLSLSVGKLYILQTLISFELNFCLYNPNFFLPERERDREREQAGKLEGESI